MLKLVSKQTEKSKDWELAPGVYTVGRSARCDIVIDDTTVSRRHAKIEIDTHGTIHVRDLDSHNGTYINNRALNGSDILSPNDQVTFGEVSFLLSDVEETSRDERDDTKSKPDGHYAGGASVTITDSPTNMQTATYSVDEELTSYSTQLLENATVFRTLSKLGKILVAPESEEAMFDEALKLLREIIVFDRLALMLLKEDTGALEVVATQTSQEKSDTEFIMSRSIVKSLLKEHNAVLISDTGLAESFSPSESIISSGIKSVVAVPLLDEDKVVGVLYADISAHAQSYTPDHVQVMATFGNILASKISNQRLLRDRQGKAILEAELAISNKMRAEVEEANHALRETQSQLVQSEKMASLGKLVAGIAHDINTPLGSIHSNTDFTLRATEILSDFFADDSNSEALNQNPRLKIALEGLLNTAKTSRSASERLIETVKSLRSFARLDQADLMRVDVHEGIDATLTLLREQLGERINIIKEYENIPQIECKSREINQVLMNVLVNAIESISDRGSITIKTHSDGERIGVHISDTGCGIQAENIKKIFDPGFTTRGVGYGGGLGLSIAYNVIFAHKGEISADSAVGQGTTVSILLPIHFQRDS